MNPNDSAELNVTKLLALRQETDALRIITERLKVKEMGPADHIRTKHEVKALVDSGDESLAAPLLQRAAERLQVAQKLTIKNSIRHGNRMTQ